MLLISSYMLRGHRWQLAALVALFFVAGCTVELYPPAQEVNNLPDGGKVDVLPDTIPRAFAFGPRIYWSQIVASDSSYSIAVTDANNKGRWLDSLRWVPSGPFVTVNGDTLSTRAYARDNSGGTDDQTLTYNGSGSLTIEDGNTVDMSDLLDNTDAQTIDTLTLQGDTMLQMSLSGDGAPVKELDLSALRSVVDSTRLTQDSILVYYQDGAEVGRDTIAGTGGSETITLSGDVTGSGTTAITTTIATGAVGADELASTAVTPGSYTSADITIDADGRITSAASGGGADNLGNHIMTQNLQTNGNWISGDGDNEGIAVDAAGVSTLTSSASVSFPLNIYRSSYTANPFGLKIESDNTSVATGIRIDRSNFLWDILSISGGTNSLVFRYNNVLKFRFFESGNMSIVGNFTTGQPVYFSGIVKGILSSVFGTGIYLYDPGTGGMSFRLDGSGGGSNPDFEFRDKDGNYVARIDRTGQLSVGSNATDPTVTFEAQGTDAIKLPVGTTAQRPTGANGLLRLSSSSNKLEAYYDAQWNTIASEEIEDDGSASDTTDGSGDITVSHTLGSASITVTATATGTTFYHVQVHSKTSTTFKIRFYNSLGPAATSTAVTADWIAKLQ